MNWILLVLASSFTAATINHLEKYLISKRLKGGGIGSLLILSAMMSLPIFFLVGLFNPQVFSIDFKRALFILLNGVIYVTWLLPYYYALGKDDASAVTPLFQLAAVFSYIIGLLVLHESMTPFQWIGALLICTGSLGLSVERIEGRKLRLKKAVFFPMALASFLVAVNEVFFKFFAVDAGFWVVTFWEYIGFFITAVMLFLFIPVYRSEFLKVLQKNKISTFGMCLSNELLTSFAKMSLNFATLLAPVALVLFVSEGFQPFFVLGIGILLTVFFPQISQEKIGKKHLAKKLASLLVMFLGTLLLVTSS